MRIELLVAGGAHSRSRPRSGARTGTCAGTDNDSIPHDIKGGPDPSQPDCREIDSVGFLTPGQSRQTAPLSHARLCEYHDHYYHSPLFGGRILIQ